MTQPTKLTQAKADYDAARKQYTELEAKIIPATQTVADARAEYQLLIDGAAHGAEQPSFDAVRKIQAAIDRGTWSLEWAERVRDTARNNANTAELRLFHARADALEAEHAALRDQAVIDAAAVDEAVEAVGRALARLKATEERISEASACSRASQAELEASARVNALLQATPRPEWPRFAKIDSPSAVRRLSVALLANGAELKRTAASYLGYAAPDPEHLKRLATERMKQEAGAATLKSWNEASARAAKANDPDALGRIGIRMSGDAAR